MPQRIKRARVMADVLALISFIEDGWFISSTRLPSKRSIDEVEGSDRRIDNDRCCPLAGACRSDVELDHSESVSDTSASESSNSRYMTFTFLQIFS